MTSIYKLEGYDIINIHAKVLYNQGTAFEHSQCFLFNYSRERTLITPLPQYIQVQDSVIGTKCVDISELKASDCHLKENAKLYLHPDCTIPRAKVAQKYSKVLKPERADYCVVPNIKRKYLTTTNAAIFLNKSKGRVFYVESSMRWENNTYVAYDPSQCPNMTLGAKVSEINPKLKKTLLKNTPTYSYYKTYSADDLEDFINSSLVYYGPVLRLASRHWYIADVIYRKLHNIIEEGDLLRTLGDETNAFTKEIYDNIEQMLYSPDSTVADIGLRTLAELDYRKYRNSVMHLLDTSARMWTKSAENCTSVAYMLKFLNMWSTKSATYTSDISPEDFELMKQVCSDRLREVVEHAQKTFERTFPFIKLDFSYEFAFSPHLEESPETTSTENVESSSNQEHPINND